MDSNLDTTARNLNRGEAGVSQTEIYPSLPDLREKEPVMEG